MYSRAAVFSKFLKGAFALLGLLLYSSTASAQFVAVMQLNDPPEGLCNDKAVYTLLPLFKGQEEPVCPLSQEEVMTRLNSEVAFLKAHPRHNDKGMLTLIINCEGMLLRAEMDTKTKSPELDEQIVAVFSSIKQWQPGRLNGQEVDSSKLWSFRIKKGVVRFE